MNIGYAIRTAREELNLSQEELADMAKVTQTTISSIERGKKRPHPGTLANIAKALKTPEVLLHIMGMEKKDCPKSKQGLYDKLFPSVQASILQIVKAK
jgi:transcriptional regulator with XRE-family HTH domain